MAEKPKVSEVEPTASAIIHIDEFLKSLEADALMKVMFRQFAGVINGIEERTKEEFTDLFDQFQNLPISELK